MKYQHNIELKNYEEQKAPGISSLRAVLTGEAEVER
jgi:hypothetical protein